MPLHILKTEIILVSEASSQPEAEGRVNEANLSLAVSAMATRSWQPDLYLFPKQK